MNTVIPLVIALGLLCGVSTRAQAQAERLSRCTDAQGQSVYTDRPCETVGARSRMPMAVPSPGNVADRDTLGARCPRRLSELVGALRMAIGSDDVNRLSSLYLWRSASNTEALRILGQLEAIARRPLVDIAPVYPQVADVLSADVETTAPQRVRPIGLRLEQVLPGSATPTRAIFGLRREYGCFWITL